METEKSTQSTSGLVITINNKPYGEADGVKHGMTGADIAAVVGLLPDNAVVKQLGATGPREVGMDEHLTINGREVFLATRKHVDGGFGGRAG